MSKTIYEILHTSSREDLSRILCDTISDCNECPGYMLCHPERQHSLAESGETYHNGIWHFLGRVPELADND